MVRFLYLSLIVFTLPACFAHEGHEHDQIPLDYVRFPYQAKLYPGDNDGTLVVTRLCYSVHYPRTVTADSVFSGITTFAKLPWVKCLGKESNVPFDIAFLGAPFVRFYISRYTSLSLRRTRIRALHIDRAHVSAQQVFVQDHED